MNFTIILFITVKSTFEPLTASTQKCINKDYNNIAQMHVVTLFEHLTADTRLFIYFLRFLHNMNNCIEAFIMQFN